MPDLENHRFAETLTYLGRFFLKKGELEGREGVPRLNSDPRAEGHHKLMGEALFIRERRKAICNFPESSDLLQSQKELYQKLVVGSASNPLLDRFG